MQNVQTEAAVAVAETETVAAPKRKPAVKAKPKGKTAKPAAKPAPKAKAEKPAKAKAAKPEAKAKQPTRTVALLELLRRKGGTTVAHLTETFGWQPHTARAALSTLPAKKEWPEGYTLVSEKAEGGRVYRAVKQD